MRIDLHCHSKHSKRPSLWLMQKIGCPESFTEPLELYQIARQKGMTGVTITDHNVIDGALEIAHLPNTTVGCEYTTYFPEDGCKVHVLVYGLDEAKHRDLTDTRPNIFDFVRYLDEHKMTYVCAHPLFWVNERLTFDHIEQLLLLFKNWELNGDMEPTMNASVRRLIQGLNAQDLARLADKHDIEPHFPQPWVKNFTAGSDDHSSLHLANAYTEAPNANTLDEFWAAVNEGHAKVRVNDANPELFARNFYGIAYQFYRRKMGVSRHVNKDLFLRFLQQTLQTRPHIDEPWLARLTVALSSRRGPKDRGNQSLFSIARFEAEKVIHNDPQLMKIVRQPNAPGGDLDSTWFDFVDNVSNKVLAEFGASLVDRVGNGRFFDLFHSVGSAGALYALLAPYFVSFSLYRRERTWSQEVLDHFKSDADRDEPHVAHFTDTFDEVNGVARTMRQQVATAQKLGRSYRILTCFPEGRPYQRGVHQWNPVGTLSLPEYPEIQLLVPPFLRMLNHCYEERFTHLHISTPGPVGLAGLAIARILQLPVSGTYHTAVPQYANILTDDGYVAEVVWKLMIWFYDQLDSVYVPSRATGQELIDKGLSPDKIKVYPRGVDVDRFHPDRRTDILQERFGIGEDEPVLIYVGRVSKEKNLPRLCNAYQAMISGGFHARLVIVGDGPYREEMQEQLASTPAVFTGYLEGDDLTAAYADADALVFPSATDTFGNVVLEAQASGIPVIVSDEGGPQENLLPDETGFVVSATNTLDLRMAMESLVTDPARREEMGKAARTYIEGRSFEAAFAQLYDMYIEEDATKAPTATLGIEPLAQAALANAQQALAS